MNVGLDGLVLDRERDGSWFYFRELVRQLPSRDRAGHYKAFVQPALVPELGGNAVPVEWVQCTRPSKLPRALFHEMYFASAHRTSGLDLMHTAVFVSPLRMSVPSVLTLHDLNFWTNAETMKWSGRFWWRLGARAGIRKADRIIVSSQATKKDLVRILRVSEAKIHVIYPWLREGIGRVEDARARLAHYDLPGRYVLFVGTIEPRKNLVNLIKAFALARHESCLEQGLVLAGSTGWGIRPVLETIESLGVSDSVRLMGRVPDQDLASLYSAADLVALVSWNEGFGLPALEGMACGVPVLASDRSSLPEVLGDAGALVRPDDVRGMAERMVTLLTDENARAEAIERGLRRARLFAPDRLVPEILAVYRAAIRSEAPPPGDSRACE